MFLFYIGNRDKIIDMAKRQDPRSAVKMSQPKGTMGKGTRSEIQGLVLQAGIS